MITPTSDTISSSTVDHRKPADIYLHATKDTKQGRVDLFLEYLTHHLRTAYDLEGENVQFGASLTPLIEFQLSFGLPCNYSCGV
jgi:hypothetical protein